ncbi:receptor-like protein EIX1 [Ipomoea triloba]|uniref:receptor-like protein EIX1 n=1 Tax=Ipomoea triloba TaxID=35885 RepID=UPI00125E4A51|nr:receptor-like protein EIX1 [Ipomoea triloba]
MITQLRPFECTQFYMTLTWLLVVGSMLVFSLAGRNENPNCIEKERQALLSFKHGIIDTQNSLSSWNSEDGNCCRWVGISCDNETGYVVTLDLGCTLFCNHLLAGELSPSLHELSYLSHLDLSGNNFTANIIFINELGNLSNLKYLDLSSNAQLKVESLEWVSGLSSLTYLGMNNLDLSSIAADWVESIKKLPMLQNLHLSHYISCNGIRDFIPDWFWDLSDQLRYLNLSYNSLSGTLPNTTLHLEHNCQIDLSYNEFADAWLAYVDISDNLLSGKLPECHMNFSNLFILNLANNNLSGKIPRSLGYLESLTSLDLSNNSFSGEFYHYILSTEDNEYKFEVDYRDGAWFALKGVKAKYGNILALLKLIDLSANQLTGQIPEGLTSLYELVSLNLSRNHFSGNIPEKIGQLTQLNSLDLSNNHLSGRIPISLANISFLEYLDLSNNELCGAIPKGTQLQSFDASKYAGNPQLCGLPTLNMCPGDEILPRSPGTQGNNKHDHWKENMGFYISLIFGFIIGFWGVCWTLLLPSS